MRRVGAGERREGQEQEGSQGRGWGDQDAEGAVPAHGEAVKEAQEEAVRTVAESAVIEAAPELFYIV